MKEQKGVRIPQLLVHDKKDNVGVMVVEDLTAGAETRVW